MGIIQEIRVVGAAERPIRATKFAVDPGVLVDIRPTVNRVRDFVSLAKPEITFMVMISAGLAFVVASSSLRVAALLNTLVGTGLVAAGAGALNQYLERGLDAQMRRTSRRPLPSGHMTGRTALFFGAALSVIGTTYLFLFLNGLTALLGILTSATYLFVYTPLKTRTSLCTLVGAIPGAAPMLMGWAAAQNNLTREAWLLYLILFLWQFPHFYAIGWLYREDYARAWMKMLPAVDEDDGKTTFRRILISSRLLILATLLFTFVAPASFFYSVLALSLGLSFYFIAYRASVSRSKLAAKTLLHASVIYLPLLYLVLLLDKFYLSASIN
ncbi:MAG TPA: heme o synthase [Pyrinomonadaceae bacterium]|nr:heme o synthase [Pyrinomonadaceae bacterium]